MPIIIIRNVNQLMNKWKIINEQKEKTYDVRTWGIIHSAPIHWFFSQIQTKMKCKVKCHVFGWSLSLSSIIFSKYINVNQSWFALVKGIAQKTAKWLHTLWLVVYLHQEDTVYVNEIESQLAAQLQMKIFPFDLVNIFIWKSNESKTIQNFPKRTTDIHTIALCFETRFSKQMTNGVSVYFCHSL